LLKETGMGSREKQKERQEVPLTRCEPKETFKKFKDLEVRKKKERLRGVVLSRTIGGKSREVSRGSWYVRRVVIGGRQLIEGASQKMNLKTNSAGKGACKAKLNALAQTRRICLNEKTTK